MESIMKSKTKLHQELRRRILNLPGVTERENAGIHGHGHCDIQLSKTDQERVLAEGKAFAHRWAPEAGYVTFVVNAETDLEPAMDLIRMSHRRFADRQGVPRMEHQ
jgi:hypothetical protein